MYLAAALALFGIAAVIILIGINRTMAKITDAANRIEASATAAINAAQQLIAKFQDLTAELRQIATNAVNTTGDDAAIQLNATADRLDQEVAAIGGALNSQAAPAEGDTSSQDEPAAVTVVVGSDALPGATVGVGYTGSLSASGGQGPYTFATTDAVPAWLSISPSGNLSGTPDAAGAISFTVTAADANGVTGSGPVSISVQNAPE